ncbi:class I mannose-6-phosphate isomerase [Aureitalea sp. L0-47]|uniref:type I phosphomannose isomerase catalytic subunit n=1 Tax=Aureitalea sp. L0-47 TaxID=2816962 RepID=UPI002238FA1E|nr:type I phosphomannose isomerase catalytic subunit [Aureitalea sp. L0-47]MCW5520253.1 class I mannose-6-phosphate isomerase [Aureitalea sp. L0-47]
MSQSSNLYPIKFHPILKPKVWGGKRLSSVLKKQSTEEFIGESWELSGVEGDISVVSNGLFKNRNLNELIETFGGDLVGERVAKRFGADFPLLFKFIDARDDLSVQLHPDDKLAQKRHASFGKTEMWYIVDTSPDARLIIGFNREMDEEQYLKYLSEGTLIDILNSEEIQPGDAYYIAPGTIHAIGGGTLLAEIQQTSDITYRVYDWDRPDINGDLRELHTELAMEAIDYGIMDAKRTYEEKENEAVLVCKSDFFETNKLKLTSPIVRKAAALDSFRVYMCIDGKATIEGDFTDVSIVKGETVLIPACIDEVQLKTTSATLLEVYIP